MLQIASTWIGSVGLGVAWPSRQVADWRVVVRQGRVRPGEAVVARRGGLGAARSGRARQGSQGEVRPGATRRGVAGLAGQGWVRQSWLCGARWVAASRGKTRYGLADMARKGTDCRGTSRLGSRGGSRQDKAGLGLARRGLAWQTRRGEARSGKVGLGGSWQGLADMAVITFPGTRTMPLRRLMAGRKRLTTERPPWRRLFARATRIVSEAVRGRDIICWRAARTLSGGDACKATGHASTFYGRRHTGDRGQRRIATRLPGLVHCCTVPTPCGLPTRWVGPPLPPAGRIGIKAAMGR